MNMFSLEGKNAWITGASYGIGFNIAKAFVGAGIKSIIFNDINEEALAKGLANYKEAGIENVHGYVCDVTDEVADSEASLCWDQAENRLTAMRGLLVYLTRNRRKPTELQIAAAKESLDSTMCRIFCDKK